MNLQKKKILFVQPNLHPPGGGNAVAVWMLEALKHHYDLHVLTLYPVDVDPINQYYGTQLSQDDFQIQVIPPIIRKILTLDPDPRSIQGLCLLMRIAKWKQNRFEAVITAQNEMDLGKRAIQYIHFPDWFKLYNKLYRSGFDVKKRKRKFNIEYIKPWKLISNLSFDRIRQNLTLVNSDWTGNVMRNFYGISSVTLYPPVPGGYSDTPWPDRENSFVCIGRMTHVKRFERIIRILSVLRSRGYGLHLHIIGSRLRGGASHQEYYYSILKIVRKHSSWITLHVNVPHSELVRIVSTSKFGIHRQPYEHFGIAVAEMIKGGCITFTHRTGGQAEIIGNEERLKYGSDAEAVRKIAIVLNSQQLQSKLRNYLVGRKDIFSTERFMNETRDIVEKFINGVM